MAICLTTLERVKRRRVITNSDNDALLEDIIEEVSDEFVNVMNRHLRQVERTEVYEVHANDHLVSLKGSPVASVTSVKHSASRDFTGVTAADAASYSVELTNGLLRYNLSTPNDPSYLEVVYSGGLVEAADDDAATIALMIAYPRLAGAATKQVIEEFNRRQKSTGDMKFKNGSQEFSEELVILKSSLRVVNGLRRIRV